MPGIIQRVGKARIALAAAAAALLVWGFKTLLFKHTFMVFNDPNEDMSFAWFVPLFSLYVLWIERHKVLASLGRPSVFGLIFALPFLAFGILGVRGIQVRFEILAFVGLLLALPWAMWGRRAAGAVLFPVMFLLFCLPLATFLDVITVHLRLFATAVAYGILKGSGVDAIRQGTMIFSASGSFSIDVAAPCSGLRSIFALMALTAGYAYFNQPTWTRRAILFSLSIPLAILGNVTRILSICIVAKLSSADFAMGFYHDYSGYVVFIVAIALMIASSEGINYLWRRYKLGGGKTAATETERGETAASAGATDPIAIGKISERGESAATQPRRAEGLSTLAVPVAFVAVLAAAMFFQNSTPEVTVAEAPNVTLPAIPGFNETEIEPSEAELEILPKDTRIIKRRYDDRFGNWFLVSVVIGGKSKSSIHRPELCLPSQGFLMTSPRTVRAGGDDWRFITLESGGRARLGFAYTFFNQEGYHTASHTARIFRDVWDRSILNRIDRWVMVTINTSVVNDESLKVFIEMLKGISQ